jgi:Cysteine-rich secretory protein family
MAFSSLSRFMWCLLWSLSVLVAAARAQQQELVDESQSHLAAAEKSSSSSTSSSSASLRGAAAAVTTVQTANANAQDASISEEDLEDVGVDVVDPNSELIPAAYAEYHATADGKYEIQMHRVPIHKLENGHEMDPWMQMALAEGIDLNEYNVTYEDGTWETLEEDHRRHLVSVTGPENNNARFCTYARRQNGLGGLSWRSDLIQQAKKQANYMATVRHIEHRGYLATGVIAGWQVITENVCQNVNIGYSGAFQSLMGDQGHRLNILHPRVKNVGIGISRYGPYYYMCQIFEG